MIYNESTNRKDSLNRLAPEIFNFKSVLYIGAKEERFDFGDEFRNSGFDITILEAYKPNADYLKTVPWIKEVFCDDVRNFKTNNKYDVVFWWHGPEHLDYIDIVPTLEKLKTIANNLLVVGCPWGEYEQGPVKGNIFEIHKSHIDYDLFESIGFDVECLGSLNVMGSNITSVFKVVGAKC